MHYVTIDHRHEVLDHAIVDGQHHHDVALVLQKHKCGGVDADTFVPLAYDGHGSVVWRGMLTFSCLDGIRQLGELLETLAYTSRVSQAAALDTDSSDRQSQASG